MLQSVLAVAVGATCGALLRWALLQVFNSTYAHLALGTLLANLLGAYLAGLALAFFSFYTQLSPEWRLLVLTGFLGSLTTFSAFSLEVVALLREQRLYWALANVAFHLTGSLACTALGWLSFAWLHKLMQ